MSEYFELSFLFKKNKDKLLDLIKLFDNEFNLKEGENNLSESKYPVLTNKNILLSLIEDDESDYIELTINFSEHKFHRDTFDSEINKISEFVDSCFKFNNSILYVLGSYELNGYLLSNIKKLEDIDNNLLLKFPIVFLKENNTRYSISGNQLEHSYFTINYQAQDIF